MLLRSVLEMVLIWLAMVFTGVSIASLAEFTAVWVLLAAEVIAPVLEGLRRPLDPVGDPLGHYGARLRLRP